MVRGVNFNSSSDILSFAARISGKGILEVRLDRKDAKPSAILEFDNTKIAETTVEGLDASAFSGIHNVYLFFASAKSVKFDAWTFTDGTVDAIEKVPERECYPVREEYFDLSGRRVDYRFDHFSGRVLIRRTVMDDGTIHTDKIVE